MRELVLSEPYLFLWISLARAMSVFMSLLFGPPFNFSSEKRCCGTSITKPILSSRGPETRVRYLRIWVSEHMQVFPGVPKFPHGHGFWDAININSAGNRKLAAARL